MPVRIRPRPPLQEQKSADVQCRVRTLSAVWHQALLVDDEADNASINPKTAPNETTAINRAIRDLLTLFTRCVGLTATPFANIFIDPESMRAGVTAAIADRCARELHASRCMRIAACLAPTRCPKKRGVAAIATSSTAWQENRFIGFAHPCNSL